MSSVCQLSREMVLLMKFLDFIFGDIRIPQAGPVFFKLLDFIFSHLSLNLTFRNATMVSFSDYVGLVIDSSEVEQNEGFLNSINMTQSFLFLLNQMMAIDQQLMCSRKNMMIFDSLVHIVRHFQFRFCLIKSTSVLDCFSNVIEDFDSSRCIFAENLTELNEKKFDATFSRFKEKRQFFRIVIYYIL